MTDIRGARFHALRFLEPDQIAYICTALPAEVRPILKFAYATGWRTPSEVLPLEWRNVDWAGRCVRLAMVVLPSEFLTGALDEMKNDLLATKRSGDALVTFSLEESYLVPPLLQKR